MYWIVQTLYCPVRVLYERCTLLYECFSDNVLHERCIVLD